LDVDPWDELVEAVVVESEAAVFKDRIAFAVAGRAVDCASATAKLKLRCAGAAGSSTNSARRNRE
jgi:hypothetical protein